MSARKARKYRIDNVSGRLHLGAISMPFPQSKAGRVAVGAGLVAGGCLGFLPVLGFWMVPLGLVVLSHDFATARRIRRRSGVKLARLGLRYRQWRQKGRADNAR
ncbi:PGPGW domain-containing protein [Rhizobium oryziradicis]|nr:PGPGW domain-containing protein [Rhizobium oryziradicis]